MSSSSSDSDHLPLPLSNDPSSSSSNLPSRKRKKVDTSFREDHARSSTFSIQVVSPESSWSLAQVRTPSTEGNNVYIHQSPLCTLPVESILLCFDYLDIRSIGRFLCVSKRNSLIPLPEWWWMARVRSTWHLSSITSVIPSLHVISDRASDTSWRQFYQSRHKLFKRHVLCSTGFLSPENDALRVIVEGCGGVLRSGYHRNITCAIIGRVGSTTHRACRKARVPCVTKEWLIESFKQGICFQPHSPSCSEFHRVVSTPFPSWNNNPCRFAVPLFHGLSFTVTNVPHAMRSPIESAVRLYGATYTPSLRRAHSHPQPDRGTTHLLAAAPEGRKYLTALKWGTVAVVSVEWLYGCLNAGQLLDCRMYTFPELPNPEALVPPLAPPPQATVAAQSDRHSGGNSALAS